MKKRCHALLYFSLFDSFLNPLWSDIHPDCFLDIEPTNVNFQCPFPTLPPWTYPPPSWQLLPTLIHRLIFPCLYLKSEWCLRYLSLVFFHLNFERNSSKFIRHSNSWRIFENTHGQISRGSILEASVFCFKFLMWFWWTSNWEPLHYS